MHATHYKYEKQQIRIYAGDTYTGVFIQLPDSRYPYFDLLNDNEIF